MVPELAVSGYPPEDLLFHSGMRLQVARSLERLKAGGARHHPDRGYPEYDGATIFNSAIVIRDGVVLANHRKACLPNYRVFDEKRYFTPGTDPTVVDFNGMKAGILVCEDVWDPEPARQAREAGAEVLLVINASPYEVDKQAQREQRGRARAGRETRHSAGVRQPDRRSGRAGVRRQFLRHGCRGRGDACARRPSPRACTWWIWRVDAAGAVQPLPGDIVPLQGQEESVYGALVQGTRDYVDKHRFPGRGAGTCPGASIRR